MVEIKVHSGSVEKCRDDALVVALGENRKLTASAMYLDDASKKGIRSYLRKFDHWGGFGDIGILYDMANMPASFASRVMILGAGDEKKLDLEQLRQLAALAIRHLHKGGSRHVTLALSDLAVRGASLVEKIAAIAEGVHLGLYRFSGYKTKSCDENRGRIKTVTLLIASRVYLEAAEAAVKHASALAEGVCLARDLGNAAANVCTPDYLAKQALALASEKLDVQVMDKAAIEKVGFTGLLAVNQGSAHEPRFIELNYQGAGDDVAAMALVGKGLTFDAGGISIKPAQGMDEMKFDMCGAAAVLGIFKAVSILNLPINLKGFIPATENLLGANAYKPGDVLHSYKGLSIEVLNTDAEGRIILADALAYAAEQKPAEIIDFATLTGACVVALGAHASGLMGNDKNLLRKLEKAGDASGDRVWPLPMYAEYQKQIDSDIADVKNVGGREAGSITAACFLSRFVDDLPWAHLDIAGTAWNMKGSHLSEKGATGAGVRVLLSYFMQKVAA